MIELQKYSKIDQNPFSITTTRHNDRREKLLTYGSAAVIAGVVLVSL
jgi:hypothetical protein